jgi:hypothetical protein
MGLPDFFNQSEGTPIVWGEPGAVLMGRTVTNNMSLDALANGAGMNGVFVDLGADRAASYAVYILAETGTAPAAGAIVEVFFSESHTSSFFPGKATGTNAAYSSTPSVATNKMQLGNPFILVATADANTELIQDPYIFYPKGRYIAPVYINGLGQALRDEATASNNTSGIILIPIIDKVVE